MSAAPVKGYDVNGTSAVATPLMPILAATLQRWPSICLISSWFSFRSRINYRKFFNPIVFLVAVELAKLQPFFYLVSLFPVVVANVRSVPLRASGVTLLA